VETARSLERRLDQDFARATAIEFAQWLVGGMILTIIPLLYVDWKSAAPVPSWLFGTFAATVFATAFVAAGLVRLRARRARQFMGGLGPRLRECGLSGHTLVAVLDNDLVLSIAGASAMPAGSTWVSFERTYNMDRTVRAASLPAYRHLRHRVRGLGAIQHPAELTKNHPVFQALGALWTDRRRPGPILVFSQREIGTKAGSEGMVREAGVDFLLPEWQLEGAAIAERADRLAALLDEAMGLAWDGPIALGRGSLRVRR
jgi:hypothetical protein